MHCFVYEFVTGGGWFGVDHAPPPASLATEGGAMRAALAADLARIEGVQVSTLLDVRLAGDSHGSTPNCTRVLVHDASAERAAFGRLCATADQTILIAPEFDGLLAQRAAWAAEAGARVLGPCPSAIALAADKQRNAECLARAGVSTPLGVLVAAGDPLPREFPYPAVIKPIDGAGSIGVRRVQSPSDGGIAKTDRRLEAFCPGLPASVAILFGPAQTLLLPACEQRLSTDGTFRYFGGRAPLADPLCHRAWRLAERASQALRQQADWLGYVGIDLILGPDSNGTDDVVIEVNPRLTTSYLGLRRLAHGNVATALLEVARGRKAALSFDRRALQFAADGQIEDWPASPAAEPPPSDPLCAHEVDGV